jgi:hypothetical protein
VHTAGVVDEKLTGSPDDALPLTVNGAPPYAWFESAAKVMVWLPCVTWNPWLTAVAAAQFALPAWAAWRVQAPTAPSVTVAPDTVHTAGVVDEKLTGSPDDALPLTVNGAAPNARLDSPPKVIVWLPCVTWKLWLTGVAAA